MTSGRWTRVAKDGLGGGLAARRVRWRTWRVRAMRRSKRFKSMARLSRSVRHLGTRLWRATPWLLIGALLLATSLGATPADQVQGARKWAAILCAVAAPFAALVLEPPRRHHPSQTATLAAYLGAMASAAYLARELVIPRANSFYSVSLLTEGALLLFALHAVQATMRRVSSQPVTAAPRAADAFVDGVRVLLISFFISTAFAWRPLAALAFVLALGFATIAVLFRTPGALAQLVRTES